MTRRLLLLAGTREARELANSLAGLDTWRVTASLADVTDAPLELAADTRTGGFGGIDGLASYLETNRIDVVVDATHPFASQMSTHAAKACERLNTPLLRVERTAWSPPSGAQWISVATLEAAAKTLPTGARAFLTVGGNSLTPFAHRDDVWFLVRMLNRAGTPPFKHCKTIIAPPPEECEDDAALMREHGITHLVTKNAGGPAGAKLEAAAALEIPTVMVERPALPDAPTVNTVTGAMEWLKELSAAAP